MKKIILNGDMILDGLPPKNADALAEFLRYKGWTVGESENTIYIEYGKWRKGPPGTGNF